MATKSFKEKIAKAKKLTKKAATSAAEGGNFASVDDGRYKAQMVSAEGPVEAQSSGRIQAVLGFKILDGEFKGETVKSFPNLENEIGQSILIRDIGKLGYEVDEFEFDDFEQCLNELDKEQPIVRITLKTKGDYQNLSIDKSLTDDDVSELEPEVPEEPEAEPEPEEEPEPEPESEAEPEPEAESEPEEEPEPEPESKVEEETLEVEEGSNVGFLIKGELMNGVIIEIVDENNGIVRVKAENAKTYKLNVEKLLPAAKKKEKKSLKKK